tara:strand:+ start:149 stop:955 length:807 start_codon:yes stop_codon:yes gene_type:complete
MAYIGRGIDKLSNIEKLDVITFDGSSSYSLTKGSVAFTPSSANSLQVSIDGVVQAGNFTVSGSTIDFGTAVASTSTNDFIFHYGTGLITTPADGTVTTGKIQDGAVTSAKLASGAVSNAPAFEATISASQTLTENAYTKLAFDTENFDTDGNYDHATNYRFTPQTAGKYFFYVNGIFNAGGSGEFERIRLALYKNGSLVYYQQEGSQSQQGNPQRRSQTIQKIIDLNGSSDYVEAFAFFEHDAQGAGILELIESGKNNVFGAYKLIGV